MPEAVIAEPDLLLFDERTSGFDPRDWHSLRTLLLALKAQGNRIMPFCDMCCWKPRLRGKRGRGSGGQPLREEKNELKGFT